MEENLTKDDLRQFRIELLRDIKSIVSEAGAHPDKEQDCNWLKGRAVRKKLDISPGSLQKLRIEGKLRFKKVLGSYYYSAQDLDALLNG